ncbi:MAG: hypothetical protein EON58_15350, partial [Alphaproteobacteria bacterium]
MTIRLSAALCLSLLLISCEKEQQEKKAPEERTTVQRATKSDRASGLKEKKEASEERRGALDQASNLPEGEERNKAIAQWVWDTFELDPELAREGFGRLTPGSEEKNRLLEHYAMRLAEQDLDGAKEWASTLDSDEEKSLAFGKIAMVISEGDPESAASLLSDSGIGGHDFDVAAIEVVDIDLKSLLLLGPFIQQCKNSWLNTRSCLEWRIQRDVDRWFQPSLAMVGLCKIQPDLMDLLCKLQWWLKGDHVSSDSHNMKTIKSDPEVRLPENTSSVRKYPASFRDISFE